MKKSAMLALVLLTAGAMVFAQSDEDFVDVEGSIGNYEVSAGFQLNLDFNLKDDTFGMSPALALIWRQYFTPEDDDFAIGYTLNAAAGVRTSMDWKVPAGVAKDVFHDSSYTGKTITFELGESIPLNISMLVGVTLKGKFGDSGFGWVFDGGIGANADMISQDVTPWWMKVFGHKLHEEIMAVNMGLAVNGGLQFRFGDRFIFEGGVNLVYCFFKMNTIDIYMVDSNGDKVGDGYSESGAFEIVNLLRLGAPYIVFGYKI
ncbi:hypothetical protein AGMMS49928_19700 [Spirochaetia bacterium]|nr:hypothetical protein AGMMS49928_19700 [Spirochaetia bacterium]